MRAVQSAGLLGVCAGFLMLLPACVIGGASSDDHGGSVGVSAAPRSFRGTYEVPVAPELASAAVFDVPEIEWTVSSGTAKLEYELPLGLVGKVVRVEFIGPLDAPSSTAKLNGAAGSAECDIASAAIACFETMPGILPITPDYGVIEDLAAAEAPALSANRLEVAKQFAVDPIGIVRIDRNAPVDTTSAPDDIDDDDKVDDDKIDDD